MNTQTQARAPKGGVTIMGVFYKGGQFLPEAQPLEIKRKKRSTSKRYNKNYWGMVNQRTINYIDEQNKTTKHDFETGQNVVVTQPWGDEITGTITKIKGNIINVDGLDYSYKSVNLV